MSDFSISFNKADLAKAEWIAYTLREAGFTVRLANWEVKPSESIMAWMEEAMVNCDRMIAVCSPDYFDEQARWSRMERHVFL